jgi:hypothetical protein
MGPIFPNGASRPAPFFIKLPAPRRIEITWQAAILLFPEKARRCILLFKISSEFR